MDDFLIGIRLRATAPASDYRVDAEVELRVGDIAVVEVKDRAGTGFGEVRRPRRPLPDFKRDRAFPRVLRRATEAEAHEWRARRALYLPTFPPDTIANLRGSLDYPPAGSPGDDRGALRT